MKKLLLKSSVVLSTIIATFTASAQVRYVDDVFSNILKTPNIEYDSNRSFNILYGSGYPIPSVNQNPFISASLKCDIYTPDGDSITARPVIIVAHTGSYIPVLVNKQTTGNKNDSSIVELCTRLAKKGYVAVAINYRLGWRATSTNQEVATQDLIQATYRGMQDVRNCIRFLRTNATMYGIDTSKIVVGGQGTGGYISLALGTVNKESEITSNPKFLRGDFTPMVNIDTMGDWNGVGGLPYFNYSGDPSISGNAHMIFNYGGAMGDSTWLEANSLPMVGIHVTTDPFAPYKTGDVRVPNGPTVIPSASGAGVVIKMANDLGVNNKINAAVYNDVYTTRAMAASGNVKNLYALKTQISVDGAPWEWWDRPFAQAAAASAFYVYPMPADGRAADSLSNLVNPQMTAAKGRAYIDTIVNFIAPRIAVQFDLVDFTGVNELSNLTSQLNVYPNPAKDELNLQLPVAMKSVSIIDMMGREILTNDARSMKVKLDVSSLKPGLYFVSVKSTDGRSAVKRVVIN
jgi:hypothetical protein